MAPFTKSNPSILATFNFTNRKTKHSLTKQTRYYFTKVLGGKNSSQTGVLHTDKELLNFSEMAPRPNIVDITDCGLLALYEVLTTVQHFGVYFERISYVGIVFKY